MADPTQGMRFFYSPAGPTLLPQVASTIAPQAFVPPDPVARPPAYVPPPLDPYFRMMAAPGMTPPPLTSAVAPAAFRGAGGYVPPVAPAVPAGPLGPGETDLTDAVDAGSAAARMTWGMQHPSLGGMPYGASDAAGATALPPWSAAAPGTTPAQQQRADSAYYQGFDAGGPSAPSPSLFVSRAAGAAPSPAAPPYVAPPLAPGFVSRVDWNAHGATHSLPGYGLQARGTGVPPLQAEATASLPVLDTTALNRATGPDVPDPAAGPARALGMPPMAADITRPPAGPADPEEDTAPGSWGRFAAQDRTFFDPFNRGGGGADVLGVPGSAGTAAPAAAPVATAGALPSVAGAVPEQVIRPPLVNGGEIPAASGAAVPGLPGTAPGGVAAGGVPAGGVPAGGGQGIVAGGLIDPRTDTSALQRQIATFEVMKNRIAQAAGVPGSPGYLHRLQYYTQLALNSGGETMGRGMENYNTVTGGITQQQIQAAEEKRKTIAGVKFGVVGHRQVVPGQPIMGTVPVEGVRDLDEQGNPTGVATPFFQTGAGAEAPEPGTPAPPRPTLAQWMSVKKMLNPGVSDAELIQQYNAMPKGP